MIVDKGSLSLEERVLSELEEEILSGKLGAIKGVTSKTVYSKVGCGDG